MKSQIRSILFVAVALFVGQPVLHANIFTYNNGDVLLVFRQPGQPNLEVNLGPVSQFINASPGSKTTITNFSSTQLQAAYSSVAALNWAVISDVRGASVYSLPVNTLFLTNPRTNTTTQTSPYTSLSTFQQGSIGSIIASVAGFGSTVGAIPWSNGQSPDAISNTPNVVIIAESDPSSYTSIAGSAGDLAGNFNEGDIENLTPSPFTSGSTRSDLYELEPNTGAGVYLGFFEFDPDGTASFTAAGGASAGSDLAVSIPTASAVSSNLTYTMAVQNNGPDPATNVVVTDTLPGGINFLSVVPNQGTASESAGVVTWNVGSLNNSGSATATINLTALASGVFTDTVSVNYPGDPVASNNTASASVSATVVITTNQVSDLAVTEVASPTSVTVGSNVTYTLTVQNNGPAAATNVVVTDALPAGVSFVSAVANQGTTTQAGGVVTWNAGNLANSGSATASIVVSTVSTGLISNTASVNYPGDPVAGNNTASATITVNAVTLTNQVSDLAVTEVASPTSVTVGSNVTCTLTVQNNGPAAATNVVVTDALPVGVSFVSALANQGTTTQAGGVVTWNVGDFANGTGASATIVVSTVSTGLISNTASVNYPGDPVASNNTASATITVNAVTLTNQVSDLAVTEVATPTSVTLGSNVTYTLTVQNNGPAAATDVVVTDALPVGVSFVSALANQGTTTQAGGVVTWNVGNLANGTGASATIVVSTVSTGLISNTASVNYPGDPVASNNTATASVTVTNASPMIEFPDLSIVKITGPKSITLTAKKPSVTKSTTVEIANVGTNTYTITSLSNLVTLAVESLTSNIPNAEVVLLSGRPQKPLPVTLKRKGKLSVVFDVTFSETTNSAFRYVAQLNDTVVSNALVNVIVKPAKK